VAVEGGGSVAVGVGALAAGWQAVMTMNHAIKKSFFITLMAASLIRE
jgi:hypothetical protein